jgi:hypothetical protein
MTAATEEETKRGTCSLCGRLEAGTEDDYFNTPYCPDHCMVADLCVIRIPEQHQSMQTCYLCEQKDKKMVASIFLHLGGEGDSNNTLVCEDCVNSGNLYEKDGSPICAGCYFSDISKKINEFLVFGNRHAIHYLLELHYEMKEHIEKLESKLELQKEKFERRT